MEALEKLKRHAELKEKLRQRDQQIAALKDQIAQIKEQYADSEAELEEVRRWLLDQHKRDQDEYVEVGYDGFKVEVRWRAVQEYDEKDPDLVEWFQRNRPEAVKTVVTRSTANRVIEGLHAAGLPLPPGAKRRTEATLYVTEDQAL